MHMVPESELHVFIKDLSGGKTDLHTIPLDPASDVDGAGVMGDTTGVMVSGLAGSRLEE